MNPISFPGRATVALRGGLVATVVATAAAAFAQIRIWVPPVTTDVYHDGWSEQVWVPPVMGTRHVDAVTHVEHVPEQSHTETRQVSTVVHHDATTTYVHHDATMQTIHHDAVTTMVHHDEEVIVNHIDETSFVVNHPAETYTEYVDGYEDSYWVDDYDWYCEYYCEWVQEEYSENGSWDCVEVDCWAELVGGHYEYVWVDGYEYEVTTDAWDETVTVPAHDEYEYQPAWDEEVTTPAYDETITTAAYDEPVEVPAYDETVTTTVTVTVVDVPAQDITVVDVPEHDEDYVITEGHYDTVEHPAWTETVVVVPGRWETIDISKRVATGDIPAIQWSNAVEQPKTAPIYAGDSTGDMVGWTVNDVLSGTYAWSASGPYFDNSVTVPTTISGPSGENLREWRVARGDDDVNHDWIDWKPGTYRIRCHIQRPWGEGYDLEYNQQVGWRSRRYLVAGQVRPIQDVSLTDIQKNDLKAGLVGMNFGSNWNETLFSSLSLDVLITAWMIGQGPNGIVAPPHVAPFPSSVTQDMKLYMIQQELNNNPDEVNLRNLSVLDTSKLIEFTSNQSYRMYSEYQIKYVLSEDKRLSVVDTVGSPVAWSGPTKITIWNGLAGLISAVWLINGWPAPNFPTNGSQVLVPSLENSFNNVQRVDRVNGRVSLYTSARIGYEASGANYGLFERDVPYIFNEIGFQLDEFGRDRANQIRLSVNKAWNQSGVESGVVYFNEVSLYEKAAGSNNYNLLQQYRLDGGAQMLNPFLMSVPLRQFHTVEPQPTVPETL